MYRLKIKGHYFAQCFETIEDALAWADILKARGAENVTLYYKGNLLELL